MNKNFKNDFRLLIYFIKGNRTIIFAGFLLYLIFFLANSIAPFLTRFLIDVVFYQKKPEYLTGFLLVCLFILLVLSVTGIVSNYLFTEAFQSINMKLKLSLFKKIQKLNEEFFLKNKSGEVNYRILNDTDVIEKLVTIFFINTPIDILIILGLGAIIFTWNFELTVFVFIVLLIQTLVVNKLKSKLSGYYTMQMGKSQDLSGYVTEIVRSLNLIKGMNMEAVTNKKVENKLNDIKQLNIKILVRSNVIGVISGLINNGWTFGVLWYGGTLIMKDSITLGILMAFLMITGMIYPRILSIFNNIVAYQNIKISFKRFKEYYYMEPSVEENRTDVNLEVGSGNIEIEGVSFGYTQNNMVLKDVNLKIKPNKVNVIVGSNGCGKTTLCKLIARFYDPMEGRILVDGKDIKYATIESLRNNISYQPQNQFLISGTILENITCGKADYNMDLIMDAVKAAKLDTFVAQLPDGINTYIGEGSNSLSGGQVQRIALARLYYSKPPIVLLDEPTTFIDAQGENMFKEIVEELKYKSTIVIVSHNKDTISLADEIINLRDIHMNAFAEV